VTAIAHPAAVAVLERMLRERAADPARYKFSYSEEERRAADAYARSKAQRRDTSHMLTPETGGPMRITLDRYEELKREAGAFDNESRAAGFDS